MMTERSKFPEEITDGRSTIKETDGLMNAILSGQTDVRTPVYEQEAKERDSNDIGYTYIEVDKENSQFILYVDGNPVIQTTGISGSIENGVYS